MVDTVLIFWSKVRGFSLTRWIEEPDAEIKRFSRWLISIIISVVVGMTFIWIGVTLVTSFPQIAIAIGVLLVLAWIVWAVK